MAELGSRLKRARERAGLTQREAAEALGMTPAAISQYEGGKRTPRAETLERMARLYGVPLGFFFGEEPRPGNWEEALLELVRTRYPEARRGVFALIERVRGMAWLVERVEPEYRPVRSEFRPLADDTPLGEAARLAGRVRDALGFDTAPVPDAKDLLEDQGVHVFALDLGEKLSGLFFDHPDLGPVVAYNERQARTRARFTLAHEFAHSRFHYDRPAILCRAGDRAPIERFADVFAAHFLLPTEGIDRWLEERGLDRVEAPEDIVRLARTYRVSYAMALTRLQGLKRLKGPKARFENVKPLVLALRLGYQPAPWDLGQRPLPLPERLPRKFLEWALTGLESGKISLAGAAELLGVSDLELEAFLEAIPAEEGDPVFA